MVFFFVCKLFIYTVIFLLSLGPCSHTVQKLKLEDVSAITVKTLKVIPDRIIDNYNKRQQLRFKCVTFVPLQTSPVKMLQTEGVCKCG